MGDPRDACPASHEGAECRPVLERAYLGGDALWTCDVGEAAHKTMPNGQPNPLVAFCADGVATTISVCLPNGTQCKERRIR